MRTRPEYDIPSDALKGEHSSAFERFVDLWFCNSNPLYTDNVAGGVLGALTDDERATAVGLLRRNVSGSRWHIIEGLRLLGQPVSAEEMHEMLAAEESLRVRFGIAEELWLSYRDPVFADCLRLIMASDSASTRQFYMEYVVWLRDKRSILMLLDLLDDPDEYVRHKALDWLNSIESEAMTWAPVARLPRQACAYRERREDGEFIEMMVDHLSRIDAWRDNRAPVAGPTSAST